LPESLRIYVWILRKYVVFSGRHKTVIGGREALRWIGEILSHRQVSRVIKMGAQKTQSFSSDEWASFK